MPTSSALAASSVGVPPNAIQDCTPDYEAPTSGGWQGGRDIISSGTSATDPAPVRVRNARLNEPCFAPQAEEPDSASIFTLPMTFQDTPVPILDEDEDGEDDGAPGGDGDGSFEGTISCSTEAPTNCATITDIITFTGGGGTYSRWCIDRSGSTSRTSIDWWDELGTGVRAGTIQTNVLGTFGSEYWECPPESDGSWLADEAAPFGKVTAWIFDPSEIAVELFETCNEDPEDPLCEDGEWGVTPPEGSDGTGYFGGTQSAHYVFGAGDEFSGLGDGVNHITCAPNYDGTSPYDIPIPEKNSIGDLDSDDLGVDRSPTPPVGDDTDPQWVINKTWEPDVTITAADCDFLIAIDIIVCAFAANDPTQFGCIEITWYSDDYANHHPYTGTDADDPIVLICTLYPERPGCFAILNPDSLDQPIVCIIEAEGDFLEWIVSWIGNLPDWIGCMVTPEGWDRSDLINRTIDAGPIGETRDAFVAVMPNGISCGELATIPFPNNDFVLDSCDADFAPAWVKTTLGWLLVLGLCVLIIRRIMRSVGGDA